MYSLKTHCCGDVICYAESVELALVMAKREGLSLRGVKLTNFWLPRFDFSGMDLRDADLTGSQVPYSDFSGADLRGAIVKDANFHYCNLIGTNCEGVDFEFGARDGASMANVPLIPMPTTPGEEPLPRADWAEAARVAYEAIHGGVVENPCGEITLGGL